ncbi:Low molecular weight protein-tyrosine-phosphatase YwlE [Lacunisphaera limnophila]|uniref:protein-tyrosine-phosphatase n=1 Tax=Lacunisphaera limnophila TaxID=1838286 RepID=A0A1D8AVI5_9BACT|nr:protein tyrosine phosphatase [Lacunisphaera limnophila]AOS44907.1 Low molecular weight protein-tyrosine-phosphatase YwlE [Lacunisphaera limnophila]
MPKPGHILVVCTGNICRSPMGQGLLAHALLAQPEPLRSLKVISAGVAAHTGEPISENSVVALRKVGIDISHLHSQGLTQKMLDDALVVFGMTESHRSIIRSRARPAPTHLHLFREFLPAPAAHEIGDPYGGPLRLYESCRDEMVEAVPSIIEFLKRLTAKT